jgi:hypothetical protein
MQAAVIALVVVVAKGAALWLAKGAALKAACRQQ